MTQIQSIYAPQTEEQLNRVLADLKKIQEQTIAMSKKSLSIFGTKTAESPNALNNAIKEIDKLNQKLKEQDALIKKLNSSRQTQSKTAKQLEAQSLKQSRARQALNTQREKAIAQNRKEAREWVQLSKRLRQAEDRYRDLAASQGLSSKETLRMQRVVQGLRAKIDGINTPIKRFGDNVGNYPKQFKLATASMRSFIGAFGLTSGIFLFAQAIRNTFNRVREFDKAMQNISGILRVSRSDISDVENEIKKVAGASIKTSREVAKLAENLFTIGKTKKEVLQLLKPVNNLAIGLETSSGEAAEFLVQMLNSFGAGSEEAEKYADVIATIRTSTSLDFQRMRDSFQYLAPISRVLNKDLAFTGALVGILSDNGLKAESAGRLLATAQQKLASENKSLNDALKEINDAYKEGKTDLEVLATASDLFGKQAGKIGVILARNSDIIEENAQAIRDNTGALDDLTNEQLKSLDAQLKILDSTWEEFILSIENGEGVISGFFSNIIGFLTNAVKGFTLLNQTTQEYLNSIESGREQEVYGKLMKTYKELGEGAEELAIKEADRARDSIELIEDEIKTLNKRNKEIEGMAAFGGSPQAETKRNKDRLFSLSSQLGYLKGILKASEDFVFIQDKEIDNNDNLSVTRLRDVNRLRELISLERERLNLSTTRETAIPIQESIKALEKEVEAILGSNNALKEKNKSRKQEKEIADDSVTGMQNQLNELKSLRDETKFGSIEWNFYDAILKGLQLKFDALTGATKKTKQALRETSAEFPDLQENMESAEEKVEALRKATDDFIKGISSTALGDLGMGSLAQFFDGTFDKLIENATNIREEFAITFSAVADVATEAFNIINQASKASFDKQFSDLARQKEVSLSFGEQTAESKREIDEQYERERAKIQKRQAEAEKRQAIFSTILSTSKGVIAALAQPIPNVPLSIAIGVIGAAKLALIQGTEIPAFKDGVENFGGGLAIVGDGGVKEYVTTPKGDVFETPSTDTLVNLPKGSRVDKDADTFLNNMYRELAFNNIMPYNFSSNILSGITSNGIKKQDLKEVFSEELKKVTSAVKNKTETHINYNENGMNIYHVKQGVRRNNKNARIGGRGKTNP